VDRSRKFVVFHVIDNQIIMLIGGNLIIPFFTYCVISKSRKEVYMIIISRMIIYITTIYILSLVSLPVHNVLRHIHKYVYI